MLVGLQRVEGPELKYVTPTGIFVLFKGSSQRYQASRIFLGIIVRVIHELTAFHRCMIYQSDQSFNGKVVAELVNPHASSDFYKDLHFCATEIPKQARELHKINKVRALFDRDRKPVRLVCRSVPILLRRSI